MSFRNVIFDLYGTLVDIRTDEQSPGLWAEMARIYAENGAEYEPDELKERYFATVAELERGLPQPRNDAHEAHPEIELRYVFQRLYRDRGVEADPELSIATGQLFRDASMEYIHLYPHAKELLTELRERGGGVWLLSNAQAIFTRLELRRVGIDRLFDGVYLSSDYGVKKPDRRFFERLLTERSIDVETAVMVGNDGACDIAPARALGLSTVYIRSNISPREPTPEADLALETMDLTRVRDFLLS